MRSIVLVALMLGWSSLLHADDQSAELRADLEKPWNRLRISWMVDQGDVAPIYTGVEVRATKDGLTIARWNEVDGIDTLGKPRVVNGLAIDALGAAVLRHYKAALASIGFHERIAALPTKAERQKERERAHKALEAAGRRPIGGIGATGIDIRISRERLESRYRDSFGDTGEKDFKRWLFEELYPKTKGRAR